MKTNRRSAFGWNGRFGRPGRRTEVRENKRSRATKTRLIATFWPVAGAGLAAWLGIAPAQAQTTLTWDAGGDGTTWSAAQPLNWSGDTVPGSQDTASLTLPSATDQAIVYDTPLYSSAALGPRTVNIGNTGGGTTTLTVSQNFYTYISNNPSYKAVNISSGGVWRQTGGTASHNDNVLINGGTLKVEGGTFAAGLWPAFSPVLVQNGGAIEVTGGTLTLASNSTNAVIGNAGTGSLTFGSAGGTITSTGFLQVGSGTTGTGTVTWNRTADMTSIARSVDIQNGTFTIASGAGRVFVNGAGVSAAWRIGTSTGTATLNKNNAANLGGDASGNLIHVGANGTVNWADGGINSNQGDDYILNQGTWNYTKTSSSATWRVGAGFRNDGTFSWQGPGGLILQGSSTANGTGTFITRNAGTLETTRDGLADLTGNLTFDAGSTFDVGLGSFTDTGLQVLASGANGGSITLGGYLDYSALSGFALNQDYTILRGVSITGDFASRNPNIQVVDDGSITGTYVIHIVPEPGTFGLLAIFAAAAIMRRRLLRG